MDSPSLSGGIAWDRVLERLPSTAHELLNEIRHAYDQGGDDPARLIERVLLSRISKLRERFETATKGDA